MPFMPQRTGPPTNSALRALQEIMMMKIQAGQRMKQMEMQHENRMKELDKAYKHDKLMAEDKWEREAPLRQLKFDIETRKVQEQNYKDQLRAKDRKFQLYKDEQDVLYKQQQARIQALTDRAANQRILNQIKLEKAQQPKSKELSFADITKERIATGIAGEAEYRNAVRAGIVPQPKQPKKEPISQDIGSLQNIFEQDLSAARQEQWHGPFPWGGEHNKKGITTSDRDIASLMIEILMNKNIPAAVKTQQIEQLKQNYVEEENFYSDPNSPKRPAYFKQRQQTPIVNPMVTPILRPRTPGAWRMNNPYQ